MPLASPPCYLGVMDCALFNDCSTGLSSPKRGNESDSGRLGRHDGTNRACVNPLPVIDSRVMFNIVPGNGNCSPVVFSPLRNENESRLFDPFVPSGTLPQARLKVIERRLKGLFWRNGSASLGVSVGWTEHSDARHQVSNHPDADRDPENPRPKQS